MSVLAQGFNTNMYNKFSIIIVHMWSLRPDPAEQEMLLLMHANITITEINSANLSAIWIIASDLRLIKSFIIPLTRMWGQR